MHTCRMTALICYFEEVLHPVLGKNSSSQHRKLVQLMQLLFLIGLLSLPPISLESTMHIIIIEQTNSGV